MIFLCLETSPLSSQDNKKSDEMRDKFGSCNSILANMKKRENIHHVIKWWWETREGLKENHFPCQVINSIFRLLLLFSYSSYSSYSRWSGGKIHFSSLLFFEKNETHTLSIHHPFSGQEVKLEDGGETRIKGKNRLIHFRSCISNINKSREKRTTVKEGRK